MGAYLSQPITKKESSDGQSEHLSFGESSMQGWRVSQEVRGCGEESEGIMNGRPHMLH